MKKQELIKILEPFGDDCEITIVDNNQDNCYEIIDIRTCEDNSSEYHKAYIDIVIDL